METSTKLSNYLLFLYKCRSFMGVNHYLGTFDSEWDAAAIYGETVSNVPYSTVAGHMY